MKTTTLAALAAVTFAAPALAQDSAPSASIDFGQATGTVRAIGLGQGNEVSMRWHESSTVYDNLADCILAGGELFETLENDSLFSAFDVAVESKCQTENYGMTMTAYYGSPMAISRLKNMP
jgi:hypothetical protein